MELAEIFRIIASRKLASAAIVLLAAGAAAAAGVLARATPTGAATVQILIDSPQSALADLVQNTEPLTTRASLFAQVMASQAVLEEIAQSAGVPVAELTAQGPYSGPGQALDVITPAPARAGQLLGERAAYRLTFLAQPNEPVVTASVQGPTVAGAQRLADSIYNGISRYVAALQQQSAIKPTHRVTIRQLGPPQAGTVNARSRLTLMALAATGVLLLGVLALLALEGLRRSFRRDAALDGDLAVDLERVAREERTRALV
ncbi:MAG TPA: Wzz/FepE/Etk N-terminal domain-containing protein [Solirubrobacteraceae bacterium]